MGVVMCLEIRKLTIDDGHDIYEMLQELPADENGFINSVHGKTFDEYKEWLKGSAKSAEQIGVVDGWKVPQTTFWLFENGKPVGIGKVRHSLTDALLESGGNVGYAIRPTARNRGLAKKLLSCLIVESKKIGAGKLLLTIRNQNIASIHVALANGGKIEKITADRHYIWIEP
jgi:Predicted acetyltransferase